MTHVYSVIIIPMVCDLGQMCCVWNLKHFQLKRDKKGKGKREREEKDFLYVNERTLFLSLFFILYPFPALSNLSSSIL